MYSTDYETKNGKVIAVWSPAHRQGGASAIAALIATMMSEDTSGHRILLTANELSLYPTAITYITRDNLTDGLSETCELASSDNLKTKDSFLNNVNTIMPRLDVLATKRKFRRVEDIITPNISKVLDTACKFYDYVVVDTINGVYNKSSLAVLKRADIVILCMPQDRYMYNALVQGDEDAWNPVLDDKYIIYVSGNHYEYDHLSYTNLKNILKEELYYVCMNEAINKATSTSTVIQFVHSGLKKSNVSEDAFLEVGSIIKTIELITQTINDNEVAAEAERDRKEKEAQLQYLKKLTSDDDKNSGKKQ